MKLDTVFFNTQAALSSVSSKVFFHAYGVFFQLFSMGAPRFLKSPYHSI